MKFINRVSAMQSLLTLSTVIMRLSDTKNTAPIPYRDSKLTRLLKPVLTGSSKVIVICNISPSSDSIDESISTLKFAERAKKIKKTIARNEELDSNALIEKYESIIRELQTRLQQKEVEISGSVVKESDRKLLEELNKLGSQLSIKEDENSILDAKLEALYQEKLAMQAELERYKSLILNSDKVKMSREHPSEGSKEPSDLKVQQRQSVRIRLSRASSLVSSHDSLPEVLASSGEFEMPISLPETDENDGLRRLLAERDQLVLELRMELVHKTEEIGVLQDELGLVKASRSKLMQQLKKLKDR